MGSRSPYAVDILDDAPWESIPDPALVGIPARLSYVVAGVASLGVLVCGLMTPWYGIGVGGESWPVLNPQLRPYDQFLNAPGWKAFLPGNSGLAIVILSAAGLVGVTMALLAGADASRRPRWVVLSSAWVGLAVSGAMVAEVLARPVNGVTQPAQTSWGIYPALALSLIATAACWSAARRRSASGGR